MNKNIILFLFSLSFLFIWGGSFLEVGNDRITALLGLIYTFGSTFYLQKHYNFDLKLIDKIIILSAPVLNLILYTVMHGKVWIYYLMNPFLIGVVFLLLSLNSLKDLRIHRNLFLFGFLSLFYSYIYFPFWQKAMIPERIENFDTEPVEKKEKVKLETAFTDSINLYDFDFINIEQDTQGIITNKAFVLLETWNEACPPCIKAFKDMPPFYESISDQVEVFYLYEHHKAVVRAKFDKIFNYKHIQHKSKILIDIDQELYRKLNISAYPYFLLFNSDGKLLYTQRGYHRDYKEKLEQDILEHLN